MYAYSRKTFLLLHKNMYYFTSKIEAPTGFHHCQNVSEVLVDTNQTSWNSTIIEFVQCEKPKNALSFYKKMKHKDYFSPPYVSLLKACTLLQDLETGIELHNDINEKGLLDVDVCIGGSLIDMYAKCGFLAKAQEVFDKLRLSNVVLWTSLIRGYVENGQDKEALNYVQLMQDQGIFLDPLALVCILKVCGHALVVSKGQEIDVEITKKGLLESNVIVGTALLNMYMKCGFLAEALNVFKRLPLQNIVSWTTLISGYAENGCGEDALIWHSRMHSEGISLNAVAFVCVLKTCGSIRAVEKGQEVHISICKQGLEHDLVISNMLIDMYAKFGLLETAQVVFDHVSARSVVSWNALLTGYTEFHNCDEVLYCYNKMQDAGISPSIVTYICCLRSCGTEGSISYGQEVHMEVVKKGFEKDHLIGSTLINMYAKCGCLASAQNTFSTLLVSDIVSWNTLIRSYIDHGYAEQVLYYFEQMQNEGILQNSLTYSHSLKACADLGRPDEGQCIYAEIVKKRLEDEILIGNTLIYMYVKYGSLETAEEVFDRLEGRDLVSWNALIAGYMEYGDFEKVLNCLQQMQKEGVSTDAITLSYGLKVCGIAGVAIPGQEIHHTILILGLEHEIISGSTLVDMYAKCGLLIEAKNIFEKLPYCTVVSCNALILGYIEDGQDDEAVNCFKQMQKDGITFDAVTIISALKACGSLRNISKGLEIHENATKQGLEREPIVGNTLVDMYGKCGLPLEAQEVFNKLIDRDVVSWTALITGYVECGHSEKAFESFIQMQLEGVPPNAVTTTASLKACGNVGAVLQSREMHALLVKYGSEKEPLLGNILVDTYSKLGLLLESQKVFSNLPCREIVSWNALITGYTQLGYGEKVLCFFNEMISQNVNPDSVTFIHVLNACNHAGLLDIGKIIFEAISTCYGCMLILEHYTCMIDLLGRAGHIEKAVMMIKEMPLIPDDAAYQTVLGACQKQGNLELGRCVFEHTILSYENHTAAYVCMSNIYAHVGNV